VAWANGSGLPCRAGTTIGNRGTDIWATERQYFNISASDISSSDRSIALVITLLSDCNR